MLARLDAKKDSAIELAIWFHDAIYQPTAGANEAASARWFDSALGPFLSANISADVVRLIMATDHSQPASGRADEDLIRDIDLSILAAGEGEYMKYAAGIRLEYAHVGEGDYVAGRSKVLRQFLAGRIFQTDRFKALEPAARRNMEAELAGLARRMTD